MRTYIDTGTPIASWCGTVEEQAKADALFDDDSQVLIASTFLRLELAENGNSKPGEVEYINALLERIDEWIEVDDALVMRATLLRTKYDGLQAIDAMHVAAAERGAADRFVTTEKPTKPLHRATNVGPVCLSDF